MPRRRGRTARRVAGRWAGLLGSLVALGPASAGQPPDPGPDPPIEQTDAEGQTLRLDELHPGVLLGLRVGTVRLNLPVVPDLVLVADERSFVEAIARWSRERWPILIDDGSSGAAEDIARFARAFKPRRVVRWRAPIEAPGLGPDRRAVYEAALARAWGVPAGDASAAAFVERARVLGLTPPGLVITSPSDPARMAALALAAGHGQILSWASLAGTVDRVAPAEDAAGLARAAMSAAAASGMSWADLGDDLDAVTLCLNGPVKYATGDVPGPAGSRRDGRDTLALTDLVGRHADDPGRRWAWCGQVIGDGPRAVYAAMCSLFLEAGHATVFDAYPDEGSWAAFDGTRAGATLELAGLGTRVIDHPSAGLRTWRLSGVRPWGSGLIVVNTKGQRDRFELSPGVARSGDVPHLSRPAAVVFHHSWSATAPGDRATIAGRWLERGAYLYLGSVQEPLLDAFVPTPILANRLAASMPLGAAVRPDQSPPWRLTVLGDPLATIGPEAPRAGGGLPLDNAEDVAAGVPALLGEQRFERAVRTLVLVGRDEDAARLGAAALADARAVAAESDGTGPDLAGLADASVPAFFRTGRRAEFLAAYAALAPERAADAAYRDLLWLLAGPDITADRTLVDLLSANLRSDQLAADAVSLWPAVARLDGLDAGRSFLVSVRGRVTEDRDRDQIDEALGLAEPTRGRPGRDRPRDR